MERRETDTEYVALISIMSDKGICAICEFKELQLSALQLVEFPGEFNEIAFSEMFDVIKGPVGPCGFDMTCSVGF